MGSLAARDTSCKIDYDDEEDDHDDHEEDDLDDDDDHDCDYDDNVDGDDHDDDEDVHGCDAQEARGEVQGLQLLQAGGRGEHALPNLLRFFLRNLNSI